MREREREKGLKGMTEGQVHHDRTGKRWKGKVGSGHRTAQEVVRVAREEEEREGRNDGKGNAVQETRNYEKSKRYRGE